MSVSSLPRVSDSLSIALFGFFNPPIFDPDWFVANGLFDEAESEAAVAEIRDSHLSLLTVKDSSLTIEASAERFVAYSSDPESFDRLKDLVVATFSVLAHTPVWALGVQREFHAQLGSSDAEDAIFDVVAGGLARFAPAGVAAKELSLTTTHPLRDDGDMRIEVGRSPELPHGLYVGVIENVDLPGARVASRGCAEALTALDELWEAREERAVGLFDAIWRSLSGPSGEAT